MSKTRWLIVAVIALFSSVALLVGNRFLSSKPNQIDIKQLSGKFDPAEIKGIFNKKEVSVPLQKTQDHLATNVLGSSDSDKWIEVDLTNQKIYAFEDNKKVYEFPTSTGKWALTPTGTFKTWVKLKYTLMKGGSYALGTYYYLPNVPYTMYFYNEEHPKTQGYGIHGAYWHNNFGHPMSHGCVNMSPDDAKTLFYWANPPITENSWSAYASEDDPGTTVLIYGETPKE